MSTRHTMNSSGAPELLSLRKEEEKPLVERQSAELSRQADTMISMAARILELNEKIIDLEKRVAEQNKAIIRQNKLLDAREEAYDVLNKMYEDKLAERAEPLAQYTPASRAHDMDIARGYCKKCRLNSFEMAMYNATECLVP